MMGAAELVVLLVIALSGLVTLVVLGLSGYLLYRVLKSSAANSQLKQTGVEGTAEIKSVRDTGITVNDHPRVELLLAVTSSAHGTYEVQTTTVVPRMAVPRVQPGLTVPVKIDAEDREKLALDL